MLSYLILRKSCCELRENEATTNGSRLIAAQTLWEEHVKCFASRWAHRRFQNTQLVTARQKGLSAKIASVNSL